MLVLLVLLVESLRNLRGVYGVAKRGSGLAGSVGILCLRKIDNKARSADVDGLLEGLDEVHGRIAARNRLERLLEFSELTHHRRIRLDAFLALRKIVDVAFVLFWIGPDVALLQCLWNKAEVHIPRLRIL